MPTKFLLPCLLLPCLLLAQRRYELPSNADLSSVVSNQIVVKLRASQAENARSSGYSKPLIEGLLNYKPLQNSQANARSSSSILDGLFIADIDPEKNPLEMCNELLQHKEVVYAEVLFREQLFQVPDDPFTDPNTGSQGYLDVIKAYDAWNLTTGSDDIVIGIVDTGMDLNHEDIIGKFYANPIETANGIDDDNNGYVDDLLGYDFADNDTNAQADGSQHGTHVGGIAGAMTNNTIGIASVGYDCQVAPLKFTTANSSSTGVWEGVLYAADNGYDIVNLSWGNFGGPSQFLQDIIDYCVLEKDMVVIAAAGNMPDDLDFYPASYEHVLSVGASTLSDTKWSSGTYSHQIDIMAPGQSIFSTQNGDTYNSDSGSSHAAPQVAGAAGLVKSVFPQYNARQIMEQLRVTTDDIYGVTGNEAYQYKLGKGRLNVLRAVSESVSRSLRVHNFSYENGFGNYAFAGDTLTLSFDLTNYLAGLNSPSIGLESDSPYVQVLTSSQPGSFQTIESKFQNEFKILITEDAPPETEIDLRFIMNDGLYTDFQNVSFYTNPDDFDFGNANLNLKIVGDGSVGFSDADYSGGYGMVYNGLLVMDYAGLMIGTNSANLNDNVTNTFSSPEMRDDDFESQKYLQLLPNEVVPFYGYSEFSSKDNNLWVEQSIIPSAQDDYLLIQYRIVNTSGGDLVNLEAGFFSNYILNNQIDNLAFWDDNLNSMVFSDNAGTLYSSLGLIQADYHHVALNMKALNGNVQDIDDTFDDTEKYDFMVGADLDSAGNEGIGNDVAGLVNTSFPLVPANGSVKMAVVLSLADSFEELSTTIDKAETAYADFRSFPALEEVIYICFGNDLIIDPLEGTNYDFYEDPLGSQFLQTGTQLLMPNVVQDTVVYISNLDGSFPTDIKRLDIRPISDLAQFELSTDTLYLDHPSLNPVTFTDESFQPSSWLWDFGNGEQSTAQNPVVNFDQVGNYPIQLIVSSQIGCSDIVSKNLVVANRPPTPEISDYTICLNETIALNHPTDEYAVFNQTGQIALSGQNITLGPFEEDSILLIGQKIEGFVSLAQEVNVIVDPLVAIWEIYPDTMSAEHQALFVYTGSNANVFEWKVDDQIKSTFSAFSYPVSSQEIIVELFVESDGCSDLLSLPVSFSPSLVPDVNDLTICEGEDAIIEPTDGELFGFYSDLQLLNLIGKGSSLHLSDLSQDQTVYVVGIDNVLPSDPISMNVFVENFSTSILADPPSIDLLIANAVHLSPANSSTVMAEWFLDGELIETALEPILFFDTPGNYEITLIGYNTSGCISEASTTLDVSLISGIVEKGSVNIFPNPAKNVITVESDLVYKKLRLVNIIGQEVLMKTVNGKKN